eukprot:CAMPEP_0181343376 /NCGR_PEP_ID=MMETSP1101-20121128/31551_1 /TAXON_ID=46948 /ORGANISM="Rhodomonas abbreviata, Strain Caron Lab Isolate" /LENGTH=69 /DNA_ID=CAMNT_0023454997 /DNA_START=9 /DNA_END=214 /DNA_ORIENTATION=+
MATVQFVRDQIALANVDWEEKLAARDLEWEEMLNATKESIAMNSRDMDVAWLVLCGALVFFMQCGFAML